MYPTQNSTQRHSNSQAPAQGNNDATSDFGAPAATTTSVPSALIPIPMNSPDISLQNTVYYTNDGYGNYYQDQPRAASFYSYQPLLASTTHTTQQSFYYDSQQNIPNGNNVI